MENYYVKQIKAELSNFYETANSIMLKVKKNYEIYRQNEADKLNSPLLTNKGNVYKDSVNNVNDIFKDIRKHIACMNFPRIEDMTADKSFFNGDLGIKLTPDEIKVYIEKYKNNWTMTRLIQEYVNSVYEKGLSARAELSALIVTPMKQMDSYKRICQSAIQNLGAIENNPIGYSFSNIENFAENENISNIIGDGSILKNIPVWKYPESVKTALDATVFLIREYGNTYEELR